MGTAKRTTLLLATVAAGAMALSGCELQRAQRASDAKTAMVGMTKEQILACMGPPASAAASGGTEVWTYNSGNGRTDTVGAGTAWGGGGWASVFGSSTTESRFCRVGVVMNGARVTRINYTGPTGGLLTEGEQCAFAVANCTDAYPVAALSPSPGAPIAMAPPLPMPAERSAAQEQSAEPPPASICSKEDKELARMARENGYRYNAACM